MKRLAISMMVFCSLMMMSGVAWCGDNGNGTVTVNGLVWMKDAGCLGKINWNDAMARAKTVADGQCGLTDKSKPGDWRLPTVVELKSIYVSKSQFKNVQAYNYWSSSTYSDTATAAWYVYMDIGSVGCASKGSNGYVWPVRGGW